MLAILLGPISSGSPNGQGGPLFSALFILLGGWMLMRVWRDYLKVRVKSEIPPLNILGLSALAAIFIVSGVWGLAH